MYIRTHVQTSIGSSGWVGGGGPRNMKSMWPPLAAIFFMTYFYRAWGGAWPPRHPPLDPLLKLTRISYGAFHRGHFEFHTFQLLYSARFSVLNQIACKKDQKHLQMRNAAKTLSKWTTWTKPT